MANTDPMGKLDLLSSVLEKGATRRAFHSDPWKTLAEVGIDRPADLNDPFHALVDALAEMSFEELSVVGRFGDGIRQMIGPLELLF